MAAALPQLPNATELAILIALADGPRHGYAIMQEVERQSAGANRLGPATLYGAIKRLLAAGWIEEIDANGPADARGKRRYRLSPSGRSAARNAARQLADTVALAVQRGLLPAV